MKAEPDQRYTPEFCEAAVRQVMAGGHSMNAVARSLEIAVQCTCHVHGHLRSR